MTAAETDFDAAALESYLEAELAVRVVGTEVLHDGLNLTVAIETVDEGEAYVLRRPNKLRDAGYMNDPEREFGVLQRLAETAVPAPVPVLFCEDESVIGQRFFVTTALDGEAVPLGADLPERFRHPRARERVANSLVDTLADVHSVAVEPFAAVCERRPPREQVAESVERFDEAASVTDHDVPTLRAVGEWLREHAPADPETTLVHGDFRPANVLFAGADDPSLSGVLDWETALLGDPLTELGYLLLRWRDQGDPTPSLDEIEAQHPDTDGIDRLRDANENGLAPFTAKSGSPSRRELVGRYEGRTGRSFERERFYRAHAAFALATVWEDLHRHQVEAGMDSDWEPHIEYMAAVADSIVSGEFPL